MPSNFPTKPNLEYAQIQDLYARKNFQNLDNYFREQNQLLDFKFFELVFSKAQTNYQVAHDLGYVPYDILVSKMTGSGAVTFRHGDFTDQVLILDVSGPCRIRFFAGTYTKQIPKDTNQPDEVQVVQAQSSQTFYAGMVMFWCQPEAPEGWLAYTDDALDQDDYPTLYAIFGRSFSAASDPASTFRLPPGMGRVPVIAGSGESLTPRAFGASGGEETHVLTTAELAAHSHTDSGHTHGFTNQAIHQNVISGGATGGVKVPFSSTWNAVGTALLSDSGTANLANTGSNSAHNNMQPWVAWYAIIKL